MADFLCSASADAVRDGVITRAQAVQLDAAIRAYLDPREMEVEVEEDLVAPLARVLAWLTCTGPMQ